MDKFMEIYKVVLSKGARNDLQKVPAYIIYKLQLWINGVQERGLAEMRKIPGFHDEALKGKRQGQRSIRLNKAYRAIYTINMDGSIEFVEIIEVNKHEY